MKKIIVILFLGVNFFLWFGVAEDPEFFHAGPFLKSRPCPKFYFSSPVGMGDYNSSRVLAFSPEKKFDEFMFQQYFSNGGIQSNPFSFKFCDMSQTSMHNFWDNALYSEVNKIYPILFNTEPPKHQ
ncbi:hypothetical protein [Aliivibrio fischeri]